MGTDHWIEISFSKILSNLESGSRPKGGVKGITEGIPSIGAEHLNSEGGFNFSNPRFIPKEFANRMNKGKIAFNDILVVKDGATTGKVSIVNEDFPYKYACVNEHVFICRLNNILNTNYCFLFLRSHYGQEQIMFSFHGGAQGGINSEFINSISIPFPSLNEQKRIVEKLDTLLPKVKRTKERLSKIPAILKKFRQSVLAAACSGRLTEDWRNQIYTGNKEYSSDDECIKIFDLPDSWSWKYLDSICNPSRGICYGVIKLGEETKEGIPCLRTSDVRHLYLDISGVKRISEKISFDYTRSILQGGEVLVNVRGTLGGVVVVPSELAGWNISREVALVPVIGVNSNYIAYVVASQHSQHWLTEVTKGVAYQGINLSDLRILPVPLPPLEEQHEIVRRVEKLFALADSLESKYKKAFARIDKIEQSILAKAFRGELVEPDPDDEPAEELLKRIIEEKAKLEGGKKKKKIIRKRTCR